MANRISIILDKLFKNQRVKDQWTAIFITSFIALLLMIFGIYAFREYGIALFLLTPLFIGMNSTILFGKKHSITSNEAFVTSLLSVSVLSIIILFFAIEGIICIIMASPISVFFTWLGSMLGLVIIKKIPNTSNKILIIFLITIPIMSFVDKNNKPDITKVVTSIEIKANEQTIWNNLIEFPKLNTPEEFLFKIGIAYPTHAKIDGRGVGAIRYCNFTTGSFVEPITIWDEPQLLQFEVLEQPAPMKELSFWDIDAPHLHDYFISQKGQFRLYKLKNGNTILEGTTWYYHNIKPVFYWHLWSDYIIHKIHEHVLNHIKYKSEIDYKTNNNL